MEALGLEIRRQLERHLDLLEEPQRERELLALVDLDVRQRQGRGFRALPAFDREGDRSVRHGITCRRLHQRDEHPVAAFLLLGTDAQLLNAQGPGTVLAHHQAAVELDRKSTRLNSSHSQISYAVFCLKKTTATAG